MTTLLLIFGVALAVMNWYLDPEHSWSWATALVFLLSLVVVLSVSRRRSSRGAIPSHAADSIRHAVVFAALMIVFPLIAKLAATMGAADNTDLSRRLTMIALGAFFVFTGNALPKVLTPLSALRCDAASVQAAQRFTGWTQVLSGLAFAGAWLLLPSTLAKPVSVAFLVTGILVIMARAVLLRRTGHKEA